MNLPGKIAVIYLGVLLFFGWGMAAGHYKIFPFHALSGLKNNVEAFVVGDVDEDLTLFQRLTNDFGGAPERLMRYYTPEDPAGYQEIALDGLNERRDMPRIRISPSAPESYRLIQGAFDFNAAFWGAILLDPQGRAVHSWQINGEIPELNDEPDIRKVVYGTAVFPDGSMAVNMQERLGGLIKIDYCSRTEWTKKGIFHHVAQLTEDQSAFWTFGGWQGDLHPILLRIDGKTGETLEEIDMADVQRANPDSHIFDLRRWDGEGHDQATHPNHVEALPAALAEAYPLFSTGDLVLSYHSTNLIFVIDPETLKIKWWHLGAGDGQHDPDWHADGTISIFNNNYRALRRGAPEISNIVSIDPVAQSHRVIVDGADHNFYSRVNGQHEFTPDGTVIITSATQGRVFEVDLATGAEVMDFSNAYDWEKGSTLHMSETFIIDAQTAEKWLETDCSAAD